MAGTRDVSYERRMEAAKAAGFDDLTEYEYYNRRGGRKWCFIASRYYQDCADVFGIGHKECRPIKKIWSECKAKKIEGTRDIIEKVRQQ